MPRAGWGRGSCRLQEEVAGGSCRLQVAGCRLQVAGCRLQVAGCRLQVAGCRLQVAGCRVQVAGCRLQVAGCRLQVAGCRLQVAGCELVRFFNVQRATLRLLNLQLSLPPMHERLLIRVLLVRQRSSPWKRQTCGCLRLDLQGSGSKDCRVVGDF